ncbi:MAG TPA: DUF1553 domain-containing protein, partial [Candidatus Hydrogenedentes bacterium]|nr:DUF1553 domain-containing protein [Candidatus Hydrogenedentota bacterium]
EKQKGGLRLDTLEAIKAGGENGPVFVAGKLAESSLHALIIKPKGDPDIMPANGEPLTPEQIAVIAKWIEAGAILPESLPDAAPAPTPLTSPAAGAGSEAKAEEMLLAKLAEGVAPAAAETLDGIKQLGGLAMPLDLKSPLMSVNLQYGAENVNDEALGKLVGVADQITWLNLAGTKVTDAGLAQLAPLKKLTRLHLERTEITDAGVAHLAALENLQYLNLYGTKVTDASIDTIQNMKALKKLYLWNSGVTAEGAAKLVAARPELYVNTGIPQAPPAPAEPVVDLAKFFDAEGCCAKAKAENKDCDHPCCVEAKGKGAVCEKCNPVGAKAAALAALFDKDGCCAKALAENKACDHPCCVEAAAKGEVCAKCNPNGAKTQQLARLDADSCCAKAVGEGKACDHPCCAEATAKGEVCAKCNPNKAREKVAVNFDAEGCCAKAAGDKKDCDHPCCVEARAKGEICAKCNPNYAKAKLSALFDADSCCGKSLAEAKDCEHSCCVEARAAGTVCTKCNPGAEAKLNPPAPTAEAPATEGEAPPGEPKAAAGDKGDKVAQLVTYNRSIRPILADNCLTCHGPDANARKANLRLDLRDSAVALHDGRAAIVPGNSEASELVRRITSSNPDDVMPPTSTGHRLKPEQIAALKQWIEAGATYEQHWSYIAVARAEPPVVSNDAWIKNPIDKFVLSNLDANGLQPAVEADRITLIRRASLDLTGLPPTPEEVDAFLNDADPNAYEKLVDRLIESPHYGERMALQWLDLVRYADTNGYHSDEARSVWPYRDYVINAFNANMPFDRFTKEQIAGDLLPNPTTDQLIASGYNRMNQLTAEGGAQPAEYYQKYMADRIRTTSSIWLGATFGCAECHDHKFDPVTAKDFYSFGAFFADVEERGVYSSGGTWDPYLELPSPEQATERAALESALAALQQTLDTPTEALAASQATWETAERALLTAAHNDWTMLLPESAQAESGATLTAGSDLALVVSGKDADFDVYTVSVPVNQSAVTALRLEVFADEKSGKLSRRSGNGNFVLTGFEVAVAGETEVPVAIASAQADLEQPEFPIAAAIDGDPATGWAVSGHELRNHNRFAVFTFADPVAGGQGTKLVVRIKQQNPINPKHTIAKFRLSASTVSAPAFASAITTDEKRTNILLKDAALRSEEDKNELAAYYRSIAPELEAARVELAAKQQRLAVLKKEIPTTLITKATQPREIKILPRGNFLDLTGEVVQPAMPAFLPAKQVTDRRLTRLDLAEWLVAPENPLTARVTVNRFWHMLMGNGLSKVVDDFGARGEWPTNPELLDWLAAEFMESGWNVKHMMRLIATSATYRQSSEASPEVVAADPFNRLYARQSTFRLAAEQVRDSALRVAGLLSPKVGGENAYPYQPEGYYADTNTFSEPARWDTSAGEDQYRRGMYTFWKRSFLHPTMLAFDAPTREECTAERVISNTPLQALALLNDPSYVEAARVLAQRILSEGGTTTESRLQYAFRRALSRAPSTEEIQILSKLCAKHYEEYEKEPDAAAKLATVGQAPRPEQANPAELAAWTSVARTILNLHELVTRT